MASLGKVTIAEQKQGPVWRWFIALFSDNKDRQEVPSGHILVQDALRESLDTVVFVVILVLVLKTFVAECFVIPTGSMAETLYGYQKIVACPECRYQFPVNCSDEVEFPDRRGPQPFCTCPNCLKDIELLRSGQFNSGVESARVPDPGSRTGDRVLVSKFHYDLLRSEPKRNDIVVFKYPGNSGEGRDAHYPLSGPQRQHTPMNYIKRLMGKPGEVLVVHGGDLYLLESGWDLLDEKSINGISETINPLEAWFHNRMQVHFEPRTRLSANGFFLTESGNGLNGNLPGSEAIDPQLAHPAFGGKYQIIRKPPGVILAEARIVYDAEKPASDMQDQPRWRPDIEGNWNSKGNGFVTNAPSLLSGTLSWLRYHHLLRVNMRQIDGRSTVRHQLITDVMGYNSSRFSEDTLGSRAMGVDQYRGAGDNWARDLIVEAKVVIGSGQGKFICELASGADRFRVIFNTQTDECAIVRISAANTEMELDRKTGVGLKANGINHHVRFANVDRNLLVWLNGKLIFGSGVGYEPPVSSGPTGNDFEPASFAAEGIACELTEVKLWRDSYYTSRDNPSSPDQDVSDWTVPPDWNPDRPLPEPLRALQWLPSRILRVPLEHYLCLGDNSANSSDSRSWGTVPRRLLLGRALLIYWPFNRIGLIR